MAFFAMGQRPLMSMFGISLFFSFFSLSFIIVSGANNKGRKEKTHNQVIAIGGRAGAISVRRSNSLKK